MKTDYTENERINKVAALMNATAYDAEAIKKYIDGAPHLKHTSLRKIYNEMLAGVYSFAKKSTNIPKVLDLGAGDGSVTLSFLEFGAEVIAVDMSKDQLDVLNSRCARFGDRLEVRCEDINQTLEKEDIQCDIIVANSLIHHIPDYFGMIQKAIDILKPDGQFFSFQDPLYYDTLGVINRVFSKLSYYFWRFFKGDLVGGFRRYVRRSRGVYLDDSKEDNTEYHVVRGGVDQEAIRNLFIKNGFSCDIVRYFSTQSVCFQFVGEKLGFKNTFAVIARKCV